MSDEQEKLNAKVNQYLELMQFLWGMLGTGVCCALFFGGFLFMLKTDGHFGDVPMLIGAYLFFKAFYN